jgi:glycine/D-amino acid oxidase-like deaminating enzyme
MVAFQLASHGLKVCVVDRERPSLGSTAASTAMLLWELDKTLRDLVVSSGFETAAEIYRKSVAATRALCETTLALQFDARMYARSSLYLAAGGFGASELSEEQRLREKANLPSIYLDHRTLKQEFGITREAAILSKGAAEANPVLLAQGFLEAAIQRGASVYDGEAEEFHETGGEAVVVLDNGKIVSGDLIVLATGYSLPSFLKIGAHRITSTWAIATVPQSKRVWPGGALIWEATENYCYARATADDRIIIGGEDADIIDPDRRDALIPIKSEALAKKLAVLLPTVAIAIRTQ